MNGSARGIAAVAFVPMSPLLFRHLSGQADPVADLREAAVEAVRAVCAGAEQVVVLCPVGGREAPGDWHDPSRVRPVHGGPRSLAEQVGEHLLELAGVDAAVEFVACTAGEADADVSGLRDTRAGTALVVLGDGAAARSQAAPGHIDERSFPYDDAVASALEQGDASALADLAARAEAAELLVTGRHTWPLAARLWRASTSERPVRTACLTHRSDPFGLSYFVALW